MCFKVSPSLARLSLHKYVAPLSIFSKGACKASSPAQQAAWLQGQLYTDGVAEVPSLDMFYELI